MSSQRHEVAVWVPEYMIMTLLVGWKQHQHVRLPSLQAAEDEQGSRQVIPEGTEVVAVTHDWQRRAFGLALSHPSFPLVRDGDMRPCWRLREIMLTALSASEVRPDEIVFEREA